MILKINVKVNRNRSTNIWRIMQSLCIFFFHFLLSNVILSVRSLTSIIYLNTATNHTPNISAQAAFAIFYTRINFKMNYGTLCTSRYRIKPSSSSYVWSVYYTMCVSFLLLSSYTRASITPRLTRAVASPYPILHIILIHIWYSCLTSCYFMCSSKDIYIELSSLYLSCLDVLYYTIHTQNHSV